MRHKKEAGGAPPHNFLPRPLRRSKRGGNFEQWHLRAALSDDVDPQALDYVFNRDKDFQKFLESPDGKKAPACLRVRNQNGTKRGRKPAAKAQHQGA